LFWLDSFINLFIFLRLTQLFKVIVGVIQRWLGKANILGITPDQICKESRILLGALLIARIKLKRDRFNQATSKQIY